MIVLIQVWRILIKSSAGAYSGRAVRDAPPFIGKGAPPPCVHPWLGGRALTNLENKSEKNVSKNVKLSHLTEFRFDPIASMKKWGKGPNRSGATLFRSDYVGRSVGWVGPKSVGPLPRLQMLSPWKEGYAADKLDCNLDFWRSRK